MRSASDPMVASTWTTATISGRSVQTASSAPSRGRVLRVTPVMVVRPWMPCSARSTAWRSPRMGSSTSAMPEAIEYARVDQAGIITTFAGTGQEGNTGDDGPASAATFGYPGALVLDPAGNLYVADRLNDVVRKIGTDGIITTFAGTGESGSSGDCAPASSSRLRHPSGLAFHDGSAVHRGRQQRQDSGGAPVGMQLGRPPRRRSARLPCGASMAPAADVSKAMCRRCRRHPSRSM